MPASVAVIASFENDRLRFVLDTLFSQWLSLTYTLYTAEEPVLVGEKIRVAYGRASEDALHIPANGLLTTTGVAEEWRTPEMGFWSGLKVMFPMAITTPRALSFDLFSAIFWNITRYEEYLNFTPDQHGRFPHQASFIHQNGLLQKPFVDEWVETLRLQLVRQFNVPIEPFPYSVQPSYDIDIAWSFLHKGWLRTLGAIGSDLINGQLLTLFRRVKTLLGKGLDPYYSFPFLDELHKSLSIKPIFFVLCAAKSSAYDKQNLRRLPAVRTLFQQLSIAGQVGIHPSYHTSTQPALLTDEIDYLTQCITQPITTSRQHYLRFTLPESFQNLLQAGITADYSMGYSTTSGFRAGTSRPFYWFDLSTEKTTALQLHPFCFMDTAAHFEKKKSCAEAFETLYSVTASVQQVGGTAMPVFHNFSLGTDPQWAGWRKAYEAYLRRYF